MTTGNAYSLVEAGEREHELLSAIRQMEPDKNLRLPGQIYLWPFVINFFSPWASYRPTVSVKVVDPQFGNISASVLGFESDPTQMMVRGLAYGLALVLFIGRFQASLRLLAKQPIYVLLVIYILLSMLWSAFPQKVFINFGHSVGMGLVALSLLFYYEKRYAEIYFFLARILSPIILASLLLCLLFPAYGIAYDGRWQGVFLNSNSLGLLCLISVWASAASLTVNSQRSIRRWSWTFLTLGLVAVFGSRSVTSITLSLFVMLGIPALLALRKNPRPVQIIKILMALLVGLILFASVIVFTPERLEWQEIFALFGRSTTLTGRTTVWAGALELIHLRPWLGWSFDSNLSVLGNLIGQSGQFHNGYLDLLVRGGWIGLTLALWLVLAIFKGLVSVSKIESKTSICILVIVLAILFHNITEASLVRETNLLWMLLVVSYFSIGVFRQKTLKMETRNDMSNQLNS
ncbi:MAG: O-antigen ligase family protein [Nitrospiraceae bacterium]|nr:O-antigen ligase family protein [Nitrospiraceae bacterium]